MTCNDFVLLFSLLYSFYDIVSEWEHFSSCRGPVHHWLLVSYGCVIGFRGVHLLGSYLTETAARAAIGTPTVATTGDFLLDWRQKHVVPRALASFMWAMALPFFAVWTLIGTYWLHKTYFETPHCVPSATHLWFSLFWLILCYVWIFAHFVLGGIALVLERRLRRAEVSRLQNYTSLPVLGNDAVFSRGQGLTATQIRALPGVYQQDDDREAQEALECSICITSLEPGDALRRLCGCGHTFHRSCVDLWLLRCADCPLCKRKVEVPGFEYPAPS